MIKLKDIYLFQDLDINFLNLIVDNSRRVEVASEEIIIRQGDTPSIDAYIIQEGQACIYHNDELITTLEAPDIFGEIALLTDEPRTATVEAKTDMVLLQINKTLLHSILKDLPNGKHIQEVMRSRIMENLERDNDL